VRYSTLKRTLELRCCLFTSTVLLLMLQGVVGCPRLWSRWETVTQSVSELSEKVKSHVEGYGALFTRAPESRYIMCGVQSTLQELLNLLKLCLQERGQDILTIQQWITKIETSMKMMGSLCKTLSSRGSDFERVGVSVSSIVDEIREIQQTVQLLDISPCDRQVETLVQKCEVKLADLRSRWDQQLDSATSLLGSGQVLHRGREFTGIKIKGDFYANNNVTMQITNSVLEGTEVGAFSKKTSNQ